MRILFAASEVFPFIKTGGLADVASALPRALAQNGHDVRVVCPKYKQLKYEYLPYLDKVATVHVLNRMFTIEQAFYEGVRYYFVDNYELYHRDTIYESDDRDVQFAVFNEVILSMLPAIDFCPDVIHCNDWQTGLVPLFLMQRYRHQAFYQNIRTMYTIHNLRFQGIFNANIIRELGYEYHDHDVNFMAQGILYASKISTVSQTYAEEILTDFYGEGLNHLLQYRQADLIGIVNGIDQSVFDPSIDAFLPFNYSLETVELKADNKKVLQEQFNLATESKTPLIGLVTRLDSQKGLDLVTRVIEELLQTADVQIFLLGSGEAKYEQYFSMLKTKYPTQFGLYIGYNEAVARLVYAASDFFLMPSLYEPCGLSQLISLKYGSIPIVRETGGLNDTVLSFNEYTYTGNGFSFKHYNAHDMLYTIRRALAIYHDNQDAYRLLVYRGMVADYSWTAAATKYVQVYQSLRG